MEKRLKKILLLILVGILIIPLLQYFTDIVSVKGLHGSFVSAKKPVFSSKDWFTTNFQQKYDKYYNENFGFRSSFVRLHNQVDYSLFHEVHANSVVVGKQEYLYEKHYISSYFGIGFLGRDSIHSRLNTIEKIYEDLKQHETEMLIIIAPGKGFFYPEYIPDSLVQTKGTTNYEVYIDELEERNIPYIDFNDLFLKMKDTTSIIIYPKTGIHWSTGILPYVSDSIFRKIESLLEVDIPSISWEKGSLSKRGNKVDTDIEKGLNLVFPLEIPAMSYPKVSFEKAKNKTKPKAIAIADSFWWQIYNMGVSKKIFNHAQFWYYYKKIYPNTPENSPMVQDINAKEEIYNSDIVILMSTESNLYKFPYGFEKFLMKGLPVISDSVFQIKVMNLMNYIKTQDDWLKKIQEKAGKREISLDSMLYTDAAFMVRKKFHVK